MDREWVLVRLSLTAADVAWLDALVADGGYRSRAEALGSIVHVIAEDDRTCHPQPIANAA